MSITLGVIADDFTGATDVANNLVRAGLRVVQCIGVPAGEAAPPTEVDAIVVALKSRTAPVAQAVAESVAAGEWLRGQGARMLYFKVCSTFDSTPAGNIGPVTEALMALTGATFVPVTPAFPENGRTVFKGHLFVGDLLLSDSPMRQHPLTPMTDANLVRVLQPQLAHERVGLVEHAVVARGAAAIRARAAALAAEGRRVAIVDAVDDRALHHLAAACVGGGGPGGDAAAAPWPLAVAGSGLALGLPGCWGFAPQPRAAQLPPAGGAAAIVSGSCSAASNAQVADFIAAGGAAFAVDALRLAAGHDVAADALAWASEHLQAAPLLVYATAPPDTVRRVQQELGAELAGALVEAALARVAAGLVRTGVRRLVVAGGETAGACVQALGVHRLRIGIQIDPGVPWCHAADVRPAAGPVSEAVSEAGSEAVSGGVHLALKSGNFGGVDFFRRAFDVLAAAPAAA